jgi:hypothetical protein
MIEADHSHPSSAEFKESVEAYLHALRILSGCVAELKKRDTFALTPILAFGYAYSASRFRFRLPIRESAPVGAK